jgi:hypothetical protein
VVQPADDWDADGFEAAGVGIRSEWFQQFLPEDHFLGARAVYLHPSRGGKSTSEGLCPRCHLVVKNDVPRMQVDGVFWHFACYKKEFQQGKARQPSRQNNTQGGQQIRTDQKSTAQQGAAQQGAAHQRASHKGPSRQGASQRGESYRQKAQRGVTERKGQGRAPPAPKAGSFALFTLREAMPSTAAIDVEVEEIKGNKDMNTHKQQSIFTYTNMCTWNTYVFKTYEALVVDSMPDWHRVSRVTEDPFQLFSKKQQALQEKKTVELLAQAKTLGRVFQGRRLTKKICTGLEYLPEDHERASEQAGPYENFPSFRLSHFSSRYFRCAFGGVFSQCLVYVPF